MSSAQTTSSLAQWLAGRRGPMLEAIEFYQDSNRPPTPARIRDYSGVPSGSFDSHIDLLMNPPDDLDVGPLVDIVDRRDMGYGHPTRIFGLTDEGERVFDDDVLDTPGFRQSDFDDLAERVDELEAENRLLRDRLSDVSNTTGDVEDRVDDLQSDLAETREAVKTLISRLGN